MKFKLISRDRKQIRAAYGGVRGRTTKKHKKTFGDEEYVHYLEYGDSFLGIYTSQKLLIIHLKYVQFIVGQLYFNKSVFLKMFSRLS